MKYSYCPICGSVELKEKIIHSAVYGYNSTDINEPKLLKPAIIQSYCPECFWKEEYKEENSDPIRP